MSGARAAREQSPGPREVGQALRFLAVGALGTAVNLVVFLALHALGLAAVVASVVAFLVAWQHNVFLHGRFTFLGAAGSDLPWHRTRYLALTTATLLVNLAVLELLRGGAGVPAGLAQLAGIATATPLNYLGSRSWVFQAQSSGDSAPNPAEIVPTRPQSEPSKA